MRDADWSLYKLLEIIETLRSPGGCLWDRQQKKEDVARYLVEEAYEVIDAIHDGSPEALKEELGDLLFQILFLVKISEEEGDFALSHVIQEISEKMIRRHPHVFGDTTVRSVAEIKSNWNDIKIHEEGKEDKHRFLLNGVPRSMPSLLMAEKITKKASSVGFDWDDTEGVIAKIDEELEELRGALRTKNKDRIKDELGDLFFSLVNLSRFVNVNPDEALRSTIDKFVRRFSSVEERLAEKGTSLADASLAEMDEVWNQLKKKER